MTLPMFAYVQAESVPQATTLLADRGGAKVLAGGHALLPALKQRRVRPQLLIDISQLSELRQIRREGDTVLIGAASRHCDVYRADVVRRNFPMLAHVAATVGDPQVRHRATIGGSIAQADPTSDIAAVLVALRAEITLVSATGSRSRQLADCYLPEGGIDATAQEIITEIRLPTLPGDVSAWGFEKFRYRSIDPSIVAVAAAFSGSASIGLAGMGPATRRAYAGEQAILAGADNDNVIAATIAAIPPVRLPGASDAYRRALCVELLHSILRRRPA
ncbi:FAD binding domain-containing protein [Dactylosporangium sp. NPDC005572]|uniref:FAD binding domain-containing protein n=1 Tax=Dactylosporangium sp. NPDC005572 TaxID=3156889 RepID=UPI00339FA806